MLLLVMVALLCIEAFAPFRLDVPGLRANGVRHTDGALIFDGPNRASTPEPPTWLRQVRGGAQFRISITAAARLGSQAEVARLLTISRDYRHADLVIAQYESDLLIRVRRRGSDDSGEPPIRVPAVFASPDVRRIVVHREGDAIEVSVDGRDAGRLELGPAGLSSWRTDFRLALGDEHLGSRSWDGRLAEAAVEVAGQRWDYVTAGLRTPRRFWYVPERLREWMTPAAAGGVLVIVAHAVLFVPVGVLSLLADRRRSRRRALVASLAIDVLVVGGKALFAGRHPSAFDLLSQFAGGAAGVSLAYLAVTAKVSKLSSRCP